MHDIMVESRVDSLIIMIRSVSYVWEQKAEEPVKKAEESNRKEAYSDYAENLEALSDGHVNAWAVSEKAGKMT